MLRYAITDRSLFGPDEPARQAGLRSQAEHLARMGIDFLQLREKDVPAGELVALARDLLATLHAHAPVPSRRPRLLIHARADVAIAAGADGVHLTSSPGELRPAEIRQLYAQAQLPKPIVSLSCHTLNDVAIALGSKRDASPDLLLFGPVFEKRVHGVFASPGTGLDLLRSACVAAAPVPVLALGGITEASATGVCLAGAAGVAGIRLFLPPPL